MAKVYISIFSNSDAAKVLAVNSLKKLQGYVRTQIAHNMNLRLAPEIRFLEDEAALRGAEVRMVLAALCSLKEGCSAQSGTGHHQCHMYARRCPHRLLLATWQQQALCLASTLPAHQRPCGGAALHSKSRTDEASCSHAHQGALELAIQPQMVPAELSWKSLSCQLCCWQRNVPRFPSGETWCDCHFCAEA